MHSRQLPAKAGNCGYAGPSNCEKTHHNIIITKTISVSLRVSKKPTSDAQISSRSQPTSNDVA